MSDGINDGHAYFEGAPIASERPALIAPDPTLEEKIVRILSRPNGSTYIPEQLAREIVALLERK